MVGAFWQLHKVDKLLLQFQQCISEYWKLRSKPEQKNLNFEFLNFAGHSRLISIFKSTNCIRSRQMVLPKAKYKLFKGNFRERYLFWILFQWQLYVYGKLDPSTASTEIISISFQQVSENQLKVSNDRGTPLICNNKLVGLLSMIIPPGNSTNSTADACHASLKTMAYYTRVSFYTQWLHSIIGVNLPASSDGKPAPIVPDSPPFQGKPFNHSLLVRRSSYLPWIPHLDSW